VHFISKIVSKFKTVLRKKKIDIKVLFLRIFDIQLSNGHSPQIRENGELLLRMWRGESHFSQKWRLENVSESDEYSVNSLANVGEFGESAQHGSANVGEFGESAHNGLANVGESGESAQHGSAQAGIIK
jgi:hypothetical protein